MTETSPPSPASPPPRAEVEEIRIPLSDPDTAVSALLARPGTGAPVRALLLLAHGAGAGMRHRFLDDLAGRLAERGVASLRYQFPYMDERDRPGGTRRPPDRRPLLLDTVRAALAVAAERAATLGPEGAAVPLLVGGKSMGGRMTSELAAAEPERFTDAGVSGVVFFGFPLHPPKRPDKAPERSAHLPAVELPLLFLQGTRDALADPELLVPVVEGLGDRARLHPVEAADHGFGVPKRSGRTDDEVMTELVETLVSWLDDLP